MAVTIKDLRFSIYLNNADAKKAAIETQRLLQAVGDEMKQLAAEGKKDTPAYREKKKAFDAMTASMEKSKLEAGLLGMSMKELRKLAITMKNDMSRMVPDSAEWKKLDADIKVVDNRIDVLRGTVKKTEGSLGKMANGFNKYFTMFTTGIASMTGVVFGAKQIVEGNAELSDSFADVQKTTNLTRQEVEGLYKDFKSLDTRTARKELLQLASDAGKLGISGSKNILDFVDAGNQIKVSLGEDLGEDAIKNIGKMVGVFGNSTKELQKLGLKEQMLAIGSAVNSIGQSSSASEQYLVAFAGRLGGVSKQAGIGIDKILGYASALDQDMQQVEMSATALQQFIMKVMGDPAKFAKLAGVSVKEFTTLLSTDANAAIVKVLKSMNDKGGFQALIPIFQDMGTDGARAVGVLSSLAGSIDKIEKEQALANKSMVEGNSITKEYNIRNNNLAASLAKLNQNMKGWFTNSTLTTWLSDLVSGLEKLTSASASATKQFDEQGAKVFSLETKIEPLLTRYDELKFKTNLSKIEQTELKKIITQIGEIIPGTITQFDNYGNAIAISSEKARKFVDDQILLMKYLKKDAIIEEEKKIKSLKADSEAARTKYENAIKYDDALLKGQSKTLTKRLIQENMFRAAEIARLKQDAEQKENLLKGANANLENLNGTSLEKQIADDEKAKKLLAEKAAKEKAYYMMSKSELKKLMDAKDELAKRIYNEKFPEPTPLGGEDKLAIQRKKMNDAMQLLENDNLKKLKTIKDSYLKGNIKTEYDYNQQLLDQQDIYDSNRKKKLNELLKSITDPGLKLELSKQIAEIDKKSLDRQIDQTNKIKQMLLDADPIKQENESYDNRLRELGLFGKKKEDLTVDQLEALRLLEDQHNENLRKLSTKEAVKALKQLEVDQRDAEKLLSERRIVEKMDEKKYKDELLKIELDFLRKKLAIQGLSADDIERITKQLNDKLIDTSNNSYKNIVDFRQKYGLDELSQFKARKELELKLLQEYLDKGLLSEKDAVKVRAILAKEEFDNKTKGFKDIAGGIADVSGNFSNALQGFQDAEARSIETKYQKQIDAARRAGKDTTKIEEQKNKELAAIRAKNADALFALQVAQIIASTAVSAINAYSSALLVPGIGLVLAPIAAGAAVVYGASQIAQANAAREDAKAGYFSGGFTNPDGNDNKPVGVVHANEFVANAKAVRNPRVKKFLDVFDMAQKNGTIHMLNTTQILEQVRTQPQTGYQGGGYAQTPGGAAGTMPNDVAMAIIAENTRAMNRLNGQLDKGIRSINIISGDGGIAKQTELYEKLKSNATRGA